jgi:hypothetical protein
MSFLYRRIRVPPLKAFRRIYFARNDARRILVDIKFGMVYRRAQGKRIRDKVFACTRDAAWV